MYKIIGIDQKEYGPISAEELRRWISEGRVNARTMVQPAGSSGWIQLGTLREFSTSFFPPPTFTTPYSYSGGGTNSMATAGLVCGILGLLCCCFGPLFSILGLVFSWIALNQINHDPLQRGRSIAIAGLVLSILGLIGLVFSLLAGIVSSSFQMFHAHV
ncbi:DUF4190 domain-containing protein [Pedosphaera parvula]|uniref:RDD domain containing protein n=1 Tax=Pedosphaera parvula (strain Ellin514) TaxID=320771 RepID=B9XJK6_PEDPL|nr:DUF4190 domain-containing protein [Pedosphaera parvula]EEF59882.1 RDD domain containing protein [Pedosphaera parvula Ellin514]